MSALDAFKAACLAQAGLPYTWPTSENGYSGKALVGCKYPEGRDCSGLVSVSLNACGYDKVIPHSWNAQKYGDSLVWVEKPEPFDFVIYGDDHKRIHHIEILWDNGLHYGAIGGGPRCLTPEIARSMGAKVQFRTKPKTDMPLLGYLRNPLR